MKPSKVVWGSLGHGLMRPSPLPISAFISLCFIMIWDITTWYSITGNFCGSPSLQSELLSSGLQRGRGGRERREGCLTRIQPASSVRTVHGAIPSKSHKNKMHNPLSPIWYITNIEWQTALCLADFGNSLFPHSLRITTAFDIQRQSTTRELEKRPFDSLHHRDVFSYSLLEKTSVCTFLSICTMRWRGRRKKKAKHRPQGRGTRTRVSGKVGLGIVFSK